MYFDFSSIGWYFSINFNRIFRWERKTFRICGKRFEYRRPSRRRRKSRVNKSISNTMKNNSARPPPVG